MAELNISMLLEHAARLSPEKPFILFEDQRMTFREVEQDACRIARGLRELGIGYGDRVAILAPNSPEFIVTTFGILKLGAVPVPIHVTTPGPELCYLLQDTGARALIFSDDYADAATSGAGASESCDTLIAIQTTGSSLVPKDALLYHEILDRQQPEFETEATKPDDPAAILYTAGTTGRPKGVVLTHLNYYYFSSYKVTHYWRLDENDVMMMVAPASHIFGQSLVPIALVAQASISILPRFKPELFFQTIDKHGVTFFAGVPTLAHLMMNSPLSDSHDLSSLRKVLISGGPLHPNFAERFRKRFGVRIMTGYGMTEGVPLSVVTDTIYEKSPYGTVGLPAMGTQIRIVDESDDEVGQGERGEIVVRGPQVFKEYANRPKETAHAFRNGWFHTGDIGRIDAEGYLFIEERLKDVIKRSGYSVSPGEVEQALCEHDMISEAAVIGIPDELLGEEIKAYVVLREGSDLTSDDVIRHCRTLLAAYKYPRIVEFTDELPKNRVGKILRRILREQSTTDRK